MNVLKTNKLNFIILLSLIFSLSLKVKAQPIILIPEDEPEIIDETLIETQEEEIVIIDNLEDININNMGLFYDNFDLWAKANNRNVTTALNSLNGDFALNAFYDVIKRLLTVSAKPPKTSKNFLLKRIQTLINMGMTSEVKQLIEAVGIKKFSNDAASEINKLYLLVSLIEDDNICTKLDLALELDAVTGQKTAIICDLNHNQKDKALFKVNLLRERELGEESFYNLVEYVAGARLTKPSTSDITASPFHLMAALNADDLISLLPENLENPLLSKILSKSSKAPIAIKIKAGEKALTRHQITPQNLADIYLNAKFTKEELNSSLTIAEKLTPEKGRALLYQAFINRKSIFEKASIIEKAFKLEKTPEAVIATSLIYAPSINEMTFSKNLEWFFDYAAVSMVYAADLTNINSVFNPLERLNIQKNPLFYILSDFWNIEYRYEIEPETLKPIACYGLDEALVLKIENALSNENSGEGLLLASSLGKIPSSKICPIYLKRVLNALKTAGFETEANLIAYQILIENAILLNW